MPAKPPIVSIIVPAYGLAHLVGQTIESILAQTYPHWEAIIVDDGAPDDVESAVQPYLSDVRFKLLKTDNSGLSTARNRAIAVASGTLIALLDGDDLYEPRYLELMTQAILADPGLGFVTCDATYFGASRVGERFSAHVPQVDPISLERVLRRDFNVFIASLIRREALVEAGGFDTALQSAEDFDLWIKIIERGWRAAYVNAPLSRYRRRADSMSANTARLLSAVINVYANAEIRLAGRPEAAVAREMRTSVERELAVIEGEALVLRGEARAGLKRLREGEPWRRSLKWYVAMPLLAVPGVARPLLAARVRFNRQF
ncbi:MULTISPECIES: glycosyltransferase family A protein [Sphingomonas]|uniref:glycosyltransferase family A protein n=1 Tax=Sphingomonas TaxID=13687 RepID=UPI00082AA4E3|nr:glycosyltransferase family A protein [Sphingomonas sp. CCH10-B3]